MIHDPMKPLAGHVLIACLGETKPQRTDTIMRESEIKWALKGYLMLYTVNIC